MQYFTQLLNSKGFNELPKDVTTRTFIRVRIRTVSSPRYPDIDLVLLREDPKGVSVDLLNYSTDIFGQPTRGHNVGLFSMQGNPLRSKRYTGSRVIKNYLEGLPYLQEP